MKTGATIRHAAFVKGVVGSDPITQGPMHTVVFIGRSNVGKSSLVNSLAQKKGLVKTGATPGKTKEINYFHIIDSLGDEHYFVDLPGYGYAAGSHDDRAAILGRIRIYLTTEAVRIDTCVLVIDAAVGLTDFDLEMLETLHSKKRPAIIVANKIDKINQKEKAALMKSLAADAPGVRVFYTSTESGFGIDKLREYVLEEVH
jgi:GTP-binding protein